MNTNHRLEFEKYVETLRKGRGKSLRETAKAIKASINGHVHAACEGCGMSFMQ